MSTWWRAYRSTASGRQRLLAFDIVLLALLFLLQGVVVSSEERTERQAHAVR